MKHVILSNQLKMLEEEGLIGRTEYAQIPPKVEYSLKEIGRKFQLVPDSIQELGPEHIDCMNNKQ